MEQASVGHARKTEQLGQCPRRQGLALSGEERFAVGVGEQSGPVRKIKGANPAHPVAAGCGVEPGYRG